MKPILIVALISVLLLFGCMQTPPIVSNNTNTSNITIPSGYEVKDYCRSDSDCVRLNKCCDCGPGEYVNTYHQENPVCTGPRCLCATMDTKGVCRENRCVSVPRITPEQPFCGWATNGSCQTDADCTSGGCSGQVCQSKTEGRVITTCEYTDCYDAQRYGLNCGCMQGKCSWN